MNYRPESRLTLTTSNILEWLTSLVVWIVNWANSNFVLLAALLAGFLATKVFRIKLNLGGGK